MPLGEQLDPKVLITVRDMSAIPILSRVLETPRCCLTTQFPGSGGVRFGAPGTARPPARSQGGALSTGSPNKATSLQGAPRRFSDCFVVERPPAPATKSRTSHKARPTNNSGPIHSHALFMEALVLAPGGRAPRADRICGLGTQPAARKLSKSSTRPALLRHDAQLLL